MYSPLVRCSLKVRRQLLCNLLPRKIMYEYTEFLKVKRGAMWHRSWDRTKIYIIYLSESISARLFVPKIFLVVKHKVNKILPKKSFWKSLILMGKKVHRWYQMSGQWTLWKSWCFNKLGLGKTWAWCEQGWEWSACSSCCCTPQPTDWTPWSFVFIWYYLSLVYNCVWPLLQAEAKG